MDYLFFSTIQLINIYCLKRRPGIVLAYILFFQQFNKLIFTQIGLNDYRYITSIIFIPTLFFLHYRRDQWHQIINNFFKSKITIGYFLFLTYMLFYSFYIGTQYEITYIKLFIFPGSVLFIISAIFFFKMNMYRDLFYGIILFSVVTALSIIFFNGLEALSDRTYSSDLKNISSITQARIAGVLCLFSIILVINDNKKYFKTIGIIIIPLSFIWLSITGTRAPLVALIFAMFFYLFISTKRTYLFKYLILSAVIVIPLLLYYGISDSLLFYRGADLTHIESVQSMTRYYRYQLFLEYFPDNFIFGLGPGGWGKYVMLGDYRYPHNIAIEFLIEYGMVGALSFSLIAFTSIKKSVQFIRNIDVNYYLKSIVLGWIFYFIAVMFSGSLLSNYEFFIYSGLIVGISRFNNEYN